MQCEVECVDPEIDTISLAQQFVERHRHRYPVLENGVLAGHMSSRDALRAAILFSGD